MAKFTILLLDILKKDVEISLQGQIVTSFHEDNWAGTPIIFVNASGGDYFTFYKNTNVEITDSESVIEDTEGMKVIIKFYIVTKSPLTEEYVKGTLGILPDPLAVIEINKGEQL